MNNAIQVQPLNQKEYAPYGDVISARDDIAPISANMGTAEKYCFVASLDNLRGDQAKPNLCFFHCNPMVTKTQKNFEIKLLEKHSLSTQAFIPMSGADRFLVVVCLGENEPDLSTLRVFLANGSQGMTYKPGVWHHPLVAMDQKTNFACLVWEDGSKDDCTVFKLKQSFIVNL